MKKRIFAILLAMCLLVGLLPTTALAGGLITVKTYDALVSALEKQTGKIYLEPAADFGWPETGTLSIPANTQIVVVDENEQKAPWEIPSGITVNFEWNTHGISCTTLTVNGTMHMAYSSQDTVLRECDKVIIGPTGVFSCEDDREGYPTVASVYIAAGETLVVQKGADMNARVRLDGTLNGEGTVSGQVEVSGGYGGTAANATLSGELALTGGLTVGRENSGYADQLTIPAGSHIIAKNLCWTSINNATLNLNGTLEFKRDSTDSGYSNPYINAGGKIVMDGGRLVLNTPYCLQEGVLDWEDEEIITFAKIQAAIPTPLIDGTGTIYFNDSESAAGEEHGWIFDCYADWAVVVADAVKDGTYDAEVFDAMTWTLVCAIDLENIALERSWAHNWDAGTVTKAATCTEQGEKVYTCADCGATKTAKLPALGHSFTSYVYNNDAKVGADGTETAVCDRDGCHATDTRTAAGTALPDPDLQPSPFTDVKADDYFVSAVAWAVENSITAGTSATTFSPNTTCTRAQVVTFLWRTAGEPEPKSTMNPFTDLKSGTYYYKAVLWAVENGITAGTSKTKFSPEQGCNRAQVATFLWRAAGEPTPGTTKNPFTDVKSGTYYYEPVLWAVENGITAGTSKTRFSPETSCTRAQIVTFLYRRYK